MNKNISKFTVDFLKSVKSYYSDENEFNQKLYDVIIELDEHFVDKSNIKLIMSLLNGKNIDSKEKSKLKKMIEFSSHLSSRFVTKDDFAEFIINFENDDFKTYNNTTFEIYNMSDSEIKKLIKSFFKPSKIKGMPDRFVYKEEVDYDEMVETVFETRVILLNKDGIYLLESDDVEPWNKVINAYREQSCGQNIKTRDSWYQEDKSINDFTEFFIKYLY